MYTPEKPPSGKRVRKANIRLDQFPGSGNEEVLQFQNDLSRTPVPDIVLRHLEQDKFRMVFVEDDSGKSTSSAEMRHLKVKFG
jgi:hypothetical protein